MTRNNVRKSKVGEIKNNGVNVKIVDSLLDNMVDGRELESIVGLIPLNMDVAGELVRAIKEIEAIRNRPCLIYAGNVVRQDDGSSGVDSSDDLPFQEMVAAVPPEIKKVDVFLSTRGGSGHQISRFVNCLRSRFDEVDFILPSFCMSAGTLFALSGDHIWMTNRACLGPIDPQVPTVQGRYVPAQALLLLIQELQEQGQKALLQGQNVPWTAVRIIDTIDKKELGDAITATNYSTMMATQFIVNYKFQHWVQHRSSGALVTVQEREARAKEIAEALASHEKWKNHGHAISREVLWNEIKLEIDHPDAALERVILRTWAVFDWVFAKTLVVKCILSNNYRYIKAEPAKES